MIVLVNHKQNYYFTFSKFFKPALTDVFFYGSFNDNNFSRISRTYLSIRANTTNTFL